MVPACCAVSGTELGYGAADLRYWLELPYAMSGAMGLPRVAFYPPRTPPRSHLRFYAMPGTDLAYASACLLRCCYVMSGTELLYVAT
eukprot:3932886-Rhodomonas_salina.4